MRRMVLVDLRRQVTVTVVVRREEVDGHEEFLARPKRSDAQHLQVLFGQRGKHIKVDFIGHEIRWRGGEQ